MWKDPIVEELHRVRESMLAEHGNDLAALARAANARAAKPTSVVPLTSSEKEGRTTQAPSST